MSIKYKLDSSKDDYENVDQSYYYILDEIEGRELYI